MIQTLCVIILVFAGFMFGAYFFGNFLANKIQQKIDRDNANRDDDYDVPFS